MIVYEQMNADIHKFKYLWDGSEPGWALLHINAGDENEIPDYFVFNTATRQGVIFEDESEFNEVVKTMLEEGVRVVLKGNGF